MIIMARTTFKLKKDDNSFDEYEERDMWWLDDMQPDKLDKVIKDLETEVSSTAFV